MEMVDNAEALRHQLDELVGQWSALMQGSSDDKQKAEVVHDERIFPLVRKLFADSYKDLLKPPAYGLVLLVGHSPDALILSASAVAPKKILFLHSRDTESRVEKVVNALGLRSFDYERRQVEKSDPISVYTEIRRAYRQWCNHGTIAVDITGGTKCMSAAAAMAGHAIGAELVYVDSYEYLPGTQRPLPGSEYLRVVQNPYHVLGDLKEEEAHSLFKRHDFRGAERIVSELRNVSLEPRRHEVLSDYLKSCDAWDSLDFHTAASHLVDVNDKLERFPESTLHLSPLYRSSSRLQSQAMATEHLASKLSARQDVPGVGLLRDKEAMSTLLFTIYACAERRADQGHFDMGSMLLYRLAEAIEQSRIAAHGLDTSSPDYSVWTNEKQAQVLADMNAILSKELGFQPLGSLPDRIGLLNGYALLQALDDEVTIKKAKVGWNFFRHVIDSRNGSILAHGFSAVSEEGYEKMKKAVLKLVHRFCCIEGIDQQQNLSNCSFIDPWAQ